MPGFSVTFLLLGMLLGVSLGLLDERDWGTLDRLRAMPVAAANVLVGKLLARFLVGVVQMVVLLAVGWLAFDVSLGPQPWALLLPTAGIVFAGCAFGLVVAARRAEPRGGAAGRLDRHRHHGRRRRLLVADRPRAALDAHRRAGLSRPPGRWTRSTI